MATASLSICGEHSDDKEYSEPISERARETVSEMKLGSDLDASIWCNLDADLLEKIFARLRFKSLYQVASLSKMWRIRVHSPSFENEVQSSCSAWKAYTPVCVSVNKELLGYESGSKCWHRLPTHDFLNAEHGYYPVSRLRACHGSLFCWTSSKVYPYPGREWELVITNPLTKTWKRIPARPNMRVPTLVHIACEGRSAYKLILGIWRLFCIDVHIYDSVNESWTEESYNIEFNHIKLGGWAYKNGVLYMLFRTFVGGLTYNVLTLDVEHKIWHKVSLDVKQKVLVEQEYPSFFHVGLFDIIISGSNLMLVVHHRDEESSPSPRGIYYEPRQEEHMLRYPRNTLSVLRLDLEDGIAWEVSRAPNEMLNENGFYSASGEDECIYFVCEGSPYRSIVYNTRSKVWERVPGPTEIFNVEHFDARWCHWSISYQPGLNPFFKV